MAPALGVIAISPNPHTLSSQLPFQPGLPGSPHCCRLQLELLRLVLPCLQAPAFPACHIPSGLPNSMLSISSLGTGLVGVGVSPACPQSQPHLGLCQPCCSLSLHLAFLFFRCVSKPQVCLTSFDKFGCSQYECVPRQLSCDQVQDPVCDTEHMEHNNLCTLYQRGKSLSYRGPCQVCCVRHRIGDLTSESVVDP